MEREASGPGASDETSGDRGAPDPARRTRVAARYGQALAKALPETGAEPTIHDAATAAVEHKGSGHAVDAAVARQVGAHLGAELGGVRVHDDDLAQQASAAMGARAFAHGADVFLGAGESSTDLGLMAHELTHVVQQGAAGQRAPQRKIEVGAANSPAETEADAVAAAVVGGKAPPKALIVDEGPVEPGQMLKSAFLAELFPQVQATASAEMGALMAIVGCPYIEQYFRRYAPRPAGETEALLKRFAPAARNAATAEAMIPAVLARVAEGVRSWRDTGKPPPDIAAADPAAAQVAAESDGAPTAPSPEGPDPEAGAAAASAPDVAAASRRTDVTPASPEALMAQLGPGAPAHGRVAEIADTLGVDGGLRIHDGPDAARLARREDAAAFTVGHHVVFGEGELQPGSLAGDALIAHEVAHVAQQTGSTAQALPAEPLPSAAEELLPSTAGAEGDADRAAGGVLARLHGGARAAFASVRTAVRAPLQLARCPSAEKKEKEKEKDKAKVGPEIAMTQEAAGQHIMEGMGKLNTGGSLDTGLHYAHNYERLCREQKQPARWKEDYRNGYANPKYWTRTDFMSWRLVAGTSASVAIKDWLAGLTIAECKSTVRVLQMDAIRAALGDDRFDQLFGSADGKAPEQEYLTIGLGSSTVTNYRKNVAPPGAGKPGDRPAEIGGQYYFTNHPTYLLKHPAGAWQGENAVYMGKVNGVQMWSGFGADSVTEDQMFDTMVRKYNEPRTEVDNRKLEAIKARNGGKLPPEYELANLPDITKAEIFSAPATTINGETRKGGFQAGNGLVVDMDAVKALKK